MKRKFLLILLACALILAGCGSKPQDTEPTKGSEIDDTEDGQNDEDYTDETETETESETESEHVPELKSITITATGDCSLGKTQSQSYGGSFVSYYDTKGKDYFFGGVRDVFSSDDFTIINLECVLTDSTARIEKKFNIKGEKEYVGIMTGSSVEAATLGNNHSSDYGRQSLIDTQNVLDEAGIAYAYQDHIGMYETEDGLTIGFVSSSVLSMSEERIGYLKNGIQALKMQDVDLIVACAHWGIEREYYPRSIEKKLAHELVDCGADVVIGCHPHVLQGIEVYNGKIICYSLGNFCFGANKNPSDKNTVMFQQTFSYVDGELQPDIDARIIPCTISSRSDSNDFRPTIASGDKKKSIIDKMNTYSEPLGGAAFDSEGKLIIDGE